MSSFYWHVLGHSNSSDFVLGTPVNEHGALAGMDSTNKGAMNSSVNDGVGVNGAAETLAMELGNDVSEEQPINGHNMHDYREFITTLYKTNIQVRTQNFEKANFRALDNVSECR